MNQKIQTILFVIMFLAAFCLAGYIDTLMFFA